MFMHTSGWKLLGWGQFRILDYNYNLFPIEKFNSNSISINLTQFQYRLHILKKSHGLGVTSTLIITTHYYQRLFANINNTATLSLLICLSPHSHLPYFSFIILCNWCYCRNKCIWLPPFRLDVDVKGSIRHVPPRTQSTQHFWDRTCHLCRANNNIRFVEQVDY